MFKDWARCPPVARSGLLTKEAAADNQTCDPEGGVQPGRNVSGSHRGQGKRAGPGNGTDPEKAPATTWTSESSLLKVASRRRLEQTESELVDLVLLTDGNFPDARKAETDPARVGGAVLA